jgi:hypothetical protein
VNLGKVVDCGPAKADFGTIKSSITISALGVFIRPEIQGILQRREREVSIMPREAESARASAKSFNRTRIATHH